MKYLVSACVLLFFCQCGGSPKTENQAEGTPVQTTPHTSKGEFTKEYFEGTDVLKFEGHKINDKPDGFCKFFYENEQLKVEAHYQYGQLNGFYKSYFPNGQLKTEGHFKQGEKTSQWKYFDDKGTLLREDNL